MTIAIRIKTSKFLTVGDTGLPQIIDRTKLSDYSYKIYELITGDDQIKNLEEHWPAAHKILLSNLDELINNAIDAFIKKVATDIKSAPEYFELTVKINATASELTIKLKDNGTGITWLTNNNDIGKTLEFRVKNHLSEKQEKRDTFLGGQNIGLFRLNKSLADINGKVEMKNRKQGGATVSLTFKQ